MDQLRPTPVARVSSPTKFVHKDLRDSTHVFVWQEVMRCALESRERPAHSRCPHHQNTSDCRARPTSHYISRPSQTCLHIRRDSAQHRQPSRPALQCTSKRNDTNTTDFTDYTFRPHSTLPGSPHYLSPLLRGEVMWEISTYS